MVGAHVSGSPRESVVLFASDHAGAVPSTGADYQVAQTNDADHVLFDMAPGTYAVTVAKGAGGKLAVHVAPGGSLAPSASGTLAFTVSASGTVGTIAPPAPAAASSIERGRRTRARRGRATGDARDQRPQELTASAETSSMRVSSAREPTRMGGPQ